MNRIAIIGAGPVGLACAGWLLQKNPNAHLDLYDRLPEDDKSIQSGDSRGIAISQGSHLLLKTLDAWPEQSPAIHQIHISHRGHFGRSIVRREELGQDALGHIVRYADIHLALRKALKNKKSSYPKFNWHFNTSIDQLNKSLLGDALIHAEGGLFKQQEWQETYRDYQQSAIVGWAKMSQDNPYQAWERFTDEGPLALLPSHKGTDYCNFVWCGHPESSKRRLTLDQEEFIKELQDAFGTRAGKFLEVHDMRNYDLGLNARKEITKGNQVWIGNAAQTMHPVAGQGLNLGLRDAHTLAQELAHAQNIPSALFEYQIKRKTDRNITIGTTDFLARIFTSKMKLMVWSRGIALSSLQLLPPIKQAITRQMMFGQR